MSYIGTEPKDIRSFGRTKFDYTATQGQTAFTGADDDGKVLAFTVGQIEVYVNGILMDDSDFTTTGTGTVTLASAANLNDVINIVSFESNIPDNDYVPASGGTFTGNITASGTLGVTGAVTASNGLTVDDDGATPLTVDRATSNGTIIDVQKDGTSVGSIGNDGNDFYVTGSAANIAGIYLANSKAMPMKSGSVADGQSDLGNSSYRWKDLYLSGGAYIGGTGSANYLDDYEEGTWTPTTGGSSDWAIATNRSCTYTKIGRLVQLTANISIYYSGSGTAQIEIGGLPFTPLASNTGRANATPWIDFIDTGVVGTIVAGVWDANAKIRHYMVRSDAAVNQYSVQANHLSSSVNSEYQINIQYLA